MRIKVVPDSEPNADGFWVQVDCFVSPNARGWLAVEQAFVSAGAIPPDHHLVAYELDDGATGEKAV